MRSEGYSTWSVCQSTTILALQATRRVMNDTNSFSVQAIEKETSVFAINTAFESVKLAPSRTTSRGPTHELAVCACVHRRSCVCPWPSRLPGRMDMSVCSALHAIIYSHQCASNWLCRQVSTPHGPVVRQIVYVCNYSSARLAIYTFTRS